MLSTGFSPNRVETLLAVGSPTSVISNEELSLLLHKTYNRLRMTEEVLLVPPDGSRPDANAPFLLAHALRYFAREKKVVIPALGTHHAMTPSAIGEFFGEKTPTELFAAHDASLEGTYLAGTIKADLVTQMTEGLFNKDFPVYVNNQIDGKKLVLAFSHIIPHEVMGFAGYSKHIVIGLGGKETIDKSHEIAALFGIDDTLGRMNTPSRRLINYANREFLADKRIVYVLLVRSPASEAEQQQADPHGMVTRGVFVGNGDELFEKAVALSKQVNMNVVKPLKEAVVFLPAANYKTFWVAMKGCYRMRLAMAEGGTLHVVCPGVKRFGENEVQETIIGNYGYQGWDKLKRLYDTTSELQKNSGVWAHLTHGSPPETSPGKPKFKLLVYPDLSKDGFSPVKLRGAHLAWGDHSEIMQRFKLREHSPVGFTNSGEYYAGNPAKALWLTQEALEKLG